MRVKCIDSIGMGGSLTLWKEYEVLKETDERYDIIDDNGDFVGYFKKRFSVIKEDKMENRIVRKLEDLDGLENGTGLHLSFDEINKEIQVYTDTELKIGTRDLDFIKCMGFKFEFQKLRTVEEVLEDMKENSLNPYNDYNYFLFEVVYDKFSKDYGINDVDSRFALGAYIFSQETAQKYADELNEIMRGGK